MRLTAVDDFLGTFTSTPFPKKSVVAKGRLSLPKLNIKVQVHDGVALRNVAISSKDGLYELLEKISKAMKRPAHSVEMGYEAPWSSKVGQKKNLAYVTNEDELDDFWVSLNRYAKGKYTSADEWGAGVVFRNMMDNLPVSLNKFREIIISSYLSRSRRATLVPRTHRVVKESPATPLPTPVARPRTWLSRRPKRYHPPCFVPVITVSVTRRGMVSVEHMDPSSSPSIRNSW